MFRLQQNPTGYKTNALGAAIIFFMSVHLRQNPTNQQLQNAFVQAGSFFSSRCAVIDSA